MFIVVLHSNVDGGTEEVHHGPFADYDEANDYVLLSVDIDEVSSSEIIELTKPAGINLTLSQGVV